MTRNFEAWNVGARLAKCSDLLVAQMQAAARHPPIAECAHVLDGEHVCRLAAKAKNADGVEKLWQLVYELGTLSEPGRVHSNC